MSASSAARQLKTTDRIFQVHLKIVQIENLPVAGINVFCKWKAPHLAAEPRVGETRPKPVIENTAVWNESFLSEVRIASLPSDSLTLAPFLLRVLVRRQRRIKGGFQTIGDLEIDLAPLAGIGEVTKTALLRNCLTNATLTLSIRLSQRGGDLVYHRASPNTSKHDAGALASIFASTDLSTDVSKLAAARFRTPDAPPSAAPALAPASASATDSRSLSIPSLADSFDSSSLPPSSSSKKRPDSDEFPTAPSEDPDTKKEQPSYPASKQQQIQETYDWFIQRRYRADLPLGVTRSRVSDAVAVEQLLRGVSTEFAALVGYGAEADVQELDLKELLESENKRLDWGALENGRVEPANRATVAQ